jgi:hypothetical protein
VNCEKWRELASEYIEGTLEPTMTAVMAEHLRGCESCRTDEAILKSLCRELNVLPEVDPPMFFRDNVLSAIERQQAAKPAGPWWKVWMPSLARTAVGTLVASGAAAAVVYNIVVPQTAKEPNSIQANAGGNNGVLLPGANAEANPSAAAPARLRITRTMTALAERGPAITFNFWLENAERGTARFQLIGSKDSYRFNLFGTNREVLQVPFDVAAGKPSVDLQVLWTADGKTHTRHIFIPIPREDNKAPESKQSFGLGQASVALAARDIAVRYGRPVTLDDVPEQTIVQWTARDETAQETLARQLAPLNLKVTESAAGLLIERALPTNSAAPTTEQTRIVR